MGWFIAAALIGGILIGRFLDEIINWARNFLNRLSDEIRKAWVYVKRVPGALKEMVRVIKYGRVEETTRTLSWKEVVDMHGRGDIDDETFRDLENAQNERKIADLER